MESTGKYYVPVYNALEGHISNVVVANPKWVRCIKGEKDDNKDAKWIADLFKLGIVRGSFIPNKDIRILRELTRYLYKLTNMRTSEKNRFTNALTVSNCKLDMVFSDIFGKTQNFHCQCNNFFLKSVVIFSFHIFDNFILLCFSILVN